MLRRAGARAWWGFKWSAAGLGTSMAALLMTAVGAAVAALSLISVGLFAVRPYLWLLRCLADLERRRLGAIGEPVPSPYMESPKTLREALRTVVADPTVRRDLGWAASHGTFGLLVGAVAFQTFPNAVRELTTALWWRWVPPGEATLFNDLIAVDDQRTALLGLLTGSFWALLALYAVPWLVRLQAMPERRLLGPESETDLTARVAELTATRAAALDAHAVELRRIERALHDGAQNRLVAVAMLTGIARQTVRDDPGNADEVLGRAQDAAETALAELRGVVRTILPPVLEDRGLEGALSALAADCPVPCSVSVDVSARCPASVESTAYFAVAEALTNAAKHSGATETAVTVRRTGSELVVEVRDNGRGGADASEGSGLTGILRRAEALDGKAAVSSPPGGPTTVEVRLPCGS